MKKEVVITIEISITDQDRDRQPSGNCHFALLPHHPPGLLHSPKFIAANDKS